MQAIYQIVNLLDKCTYIGSTKNLKVRKRQHFNALRKNTHHSYKLQNAFNSSKEELFELLLLEELPTLAGREALLERERFWVEKLQPEYNIAIVNGGYELKGHPRETEIREKLSICMTKWWDSASEDSKDKVSSLRNEGRDTYWASKEQRTGPEGHNWKGGDGMQKICRCGASMTPSAVLCKTCTSEVPPRNAREVSVDGAIFNSVRAAADHYGVDPGTIRNKLKSTADKWKTYFYTEKAKSHSREISCEGILYKDLGEAATHYGVAKGTLRYRACAKGKKWDAFFYTDT